MALAESASRFELAPSRENFSHIPEVLPLPNLIQTQTESFSWFIKTGLRELLDEITPITDFTGKNLELHFRDYYFEEPKFSEEECRTRDLTFSRPLKVEVDLVIKETDEVKHQTVFMGDFPWMTEQGTFIINGAERVVVSQLVRSPGVYYTGSEDPATGRILFAAKVIPNRGAWLEFETSNKDLLSVKVDRKRKIPVTTLLRAVGFDESAEMVKPLRAGRRQPGAPVRPADARQGHRPDPGRGPDRGLQEAAPRRSADRGQRPRAGHQPLLQLPPLRPRSRRPLQAEQGTGRCRRQAEDRAALGGEREPARRADHQPQRHRGDHRQADRAEQRPRRAPTTSTTWATGASAPTAS